jgi:Amt family ammonium transporter
LHSKKACQSVDIMNRKLTYNELVKRIQELEGVNENYSSVFDNTGTAIIIVEEDTTISLANSKFESMSGVTKKEIEGRMNLAQFFSQNEKAKVIEHHVLRRMDTPLVPPAYETEMVDSIGNVIPVYMSVSMIPGSKKSVASILDLSEIKHTREALFKQQAYFSQLFKSSPQAIMMVDVAGKILGVNKSFQSLFGHEPEKIIGQYGQQIVVPDDRIDESQALHQSALNGESIRTETLGQHKNGQLIPISMISYPVIINDQTEGFFYIYDDISERKTFEEQLHRQAFYDSLTGLPNRILFMERLGRAVQVAKRKKKYSFAVLLIDLDSFKDVNDSLGHQAGDSLLIEIANRFHSCTRSVDTVARLGGDEFAIITEDYEDTNEIIQIAKRIQSVAEMPFHMDNAVTHISTSIGIVLEAQPYDDPENILRDADIAMYRAKAKGRACFKIFNQKMHELVVESQTIENELREAIQNKELRLHYQPIISTGTGKLSGFEALVRWEHPKRGLLFPDKFIEIAEKTSLINPLGRWVLIEACQQMEKWHTSFPEYQNLTINVNFSVKQFMEKDLVNFIVKTLHQSGLDPKDLKVEITESILMKASQDVVEKFRRIRDIGIKLVIDDFGTGYSSLSYLQQFPIDCLKIDRSFINAMNLEQESMEIVKTIVGLAKNLGLSVVAEGVEDENQFKKLKEINCDMVQGFLFSRPVDSNSAAELIKKFC